MESSCCRGPSKLRRATPRLEGWAGDSTDFAAGLHEIWHEYRQGQAVGPACYSRTDLCLLPWAAPRHPGIEHPDREQAQESGGEIAGGPVEVIDPGLDHGEAQDIGIFLAQECDQAAHGHSA